MFVYPTFLWALFTVSIPIIIHLFNFRRYTKVYFTNVRYLKELQHESKSKSRLKELLILLFRCLAITALVLAFAQPVLVENKSITAGPSVKAISIYIDNSYSMDNLQKQGPLLEIAKQQAKDLIKNMGNADKIQILTNDFEGRHQRFYNKEEALDPLSEIKSSPSVRKLSEVYKRQLEMLRSSGSKNISNYLFTDAQRSTFDLNEVKQDSTARTFIVLNAANKINNVYVDTCFFETPVQQKGFIQKLHARIRNNGDDPVNAGSAKLTLNKLQLGISSFSVEPHAFKEIVFTFECKQEGFNYGSIKIDDYPVTFDDELFFAFNSKLKIRLTLISGKDIKGENPFLNLLKADSLFELHSSNEQSVDYSSFEKSDALVLYGLSGLTSGMQSELFKFRRTKGCLFIIPAEKADLSSYNTLMSAFALPSIIGKDTQQVKTDLIEQKSDFFSGVFEKLDERVNLPLIQEHYKLNLTNRSSFEVLMKLQNGDPLLGRIEDQGNITYLSTDPMTDQSSNFVRHALFVPTMYRIGFSSLHAASLFYEVNANEVLDLRYESSVNKEAPHILGLTDKTDIIPEVRNTNSGLHLFTRGQINQAGFYSVNANRESLFPLAFNYSRKESDLTCYNKEELNTILTERGLNSFRIIESDQKDPFTVMNAGLNGTPLWKLFVILALSFLLIEIVLLRFIK